MAEVVLIDKPKFPVIDPDPSPKMIFQTFRASDWRNFTLATAVSFPFGYWAGRPVLMRPGMYMGGFLGASFGIFFGMQLTFARLVGFQENGREVARYGVHNPNPAPTST